MRKAPKLPICQQYELYNGNPVAVLFRDKTTDKTEPCPFCAQAHKHGYPDGHRSSHCSDNVTYKRTRGFLYEVKLTPDEVTSSDGTILKREHGYIVQTRPNQPIKDELISLAIAVVTVLDIKAKAGQYKQSWIGYENGKGIEVGTAIERIINQAKRILHNHNK